MTKWYKNKNWGGSGAGLVVMGGDSWSEVHGFESEHRILDGLFLHWLLVKLHWYLFEKDQKLMIKRPGMAS